MARDAIARLYDVDEHRVDFKRFHISRKYDHANVTFSARPGKSIDLSKLHESIWATRLSGGTRSGVICLEVTAVGDVSARDDEIVLRGADGKEFVLVDDVRAKPEEAKSSRFAALRRSLARGEPITRVTGYVEGWVGRWPTVLNRPPAERPRLMVTSFEVASE